MGKLPPHFNRLLRPEIGFFLAVGATVGVAAILVSELQQRWLFTVIAGLMFGVLLTWSRGRWERITFFVMMFAGFFSIDAHFLLVEGHQGGAIGLRVSLPFLLMTLLYVPFIRDVIAGREQIRIIRWITVPLLLYLAAALVSSLYSSTPLLGVYQIIQILQSYLLFLYLSNRLRRGEDISGILYAATLALALHGIMTIVQKYGSLHLDLRFFGAVLEDMLEDVGGQVILRPRGFFRHPIVLASFVVLACPLCLTLMIFARHAAVRLGAFAAGLLGVFALVLSLSRGAWLGMAVSLTLLFLIVAVKRIIPSATLVRLSILSVFIMLTVIAVKGEEMYLRFVASRFGPVQVRFELNRVAFDMIREHPILGIGFNNFTQVMQDYERLTAYVPMFHYPVHNIYLLEFSETGFVGGSFFLLLLFGILRTAFKAMDQTSRIMRFVSVAALCGIIGYMVGLITDFSLRLPEMHTIFWMVAGIAGALLLRREEADAGASPLSTGQARVVWV